MAHFTKFTRGAMGNMTKHFERGKDSNGKYVSHKRENIDESRSHLNYNLAPNGNQIDRIHERLKDVYCMNRNDVNLMCSWVVTVPKTVPEEYHREFFERTYDYLEAKYGAKNVVSAYVHMDETTPHIHFAFVPVIYDKKKEREKVSAKECVKQSDLKRFHNDFQRYMDDFTEKHHNAFECDVLNGATGNGNKTIQRLQSEMLEEVNQNAYEMIEQLQEKCEGIIQRNEALEEINRNLQQNAEKLIEENKQLENFQKNQRIEIESMNTDKFNLFQRFLDIFPDAKKLFDKFCKGEEERSNAVREKISNVHESRLSMMEDYDVVIAKMRADSPVKPKSSYVEHIKGNSRHTRE